MTDKLIQEVTPARQQAGEARLEEAVRVAGLSGDHVWIAVLAHLVVDPGKTGPQLYDAESLVSHHIGCYVCEGEYSPRLATRRCKGEPI